MNLARRWLVCGSYASATARCASIGALLGVAQTPPEELIASATEWARCDNRISALALLGSHARGEARPDSDIAFCLICPDARRLLGDRSWTEQFGPATQLGLEPYGLVTSVRVRYRDGPEVEFGIADHAWMDVPVDPDTAAVMRAGMRILHDPENRLQRALDDASRTCPE